MEVMNTPKENSKSPQHPAPQHVPWQGKLGKGLKRKALQGLCSQQGGGQVALHPSAANFGVCCKGHGLFAARQTSCPAVRKGVYRISSPDRSRITQAARYQSLTHFCIFLIHGAGKSAVIFLLVCSNTQYPKGFRLKTQWHGSVCARKLLSTRQLPLEECGYHQL